MSAIRIAVPGYDAARIAENSLPSLRQRAQRCCHRNGSPVAAVFFTIRYTQRALTMALASPFNRSAEPKRFSSFSLSA